MNRIEELEGLRGLMAWWVVIGHILFALSDTLGRLSHNTSGVLVFITLSGFVIFLLLDRQRERADLFLVRRALRLYPVYVVTLLIFVLSLDLKIDALQNAVIPTVRNASNLASSVSAANHLLAHIAAHLTMLHGLVPEAVLRHADFAICGPMWSISVEWQFYLLAPLIFAGVNAGRWGVAGILLASAGLYLLSTAPLLKDNYAFVGRYVSWFAIGIGSYYLWRMGDRRWLAAGAVVLAAWGLATTEPARLVWAAVLAIFAGVPGSQWLSAFLRWAPVRRLGEISYSTYLCHLAPLYFSMWAFRDLPPAQYASGLVLGTVVGTIVLSFPLHHYVEKPGIRVGASLARKSASTTQAA